MAKKKITGARHKRKFLAEAQQEVSLKAVDSPQELLLKAASAFSNGDIQTTLHICHELLQTNPDHDGALNLVGCAYAAYDRPDKAVEYFKKAIEFNPQGEGYYLNAGRASLLINKYQEALSYLQQAVELKEHPEPYFWMGRTYATQLKLSQAEECFKKVLELQPGHQMALENLASVLEQVNKPEEAEEVINRIISLNLQSYLFLLSRAKLERRRKNYEEARQAVEKFLIFAKTNQEKGLGLNEKAKIFDKEGKFDEAFDTYVKAQSKSSEAYKDKEVSHYFSNILAASLEWFDEENVSSWPEQPVEQTDKPPVFLLGFFRSGTTFTEQIISAHPGIISTQEANIVDNVMLNMGNILQYAPHYPHVLNDLTAENVKALRQDYQEKLALAFEEEDIEGKLLIDKMPFNISLLGFIYRLFPEARIITLIRDPRDVCLSSFMQPFTHNPTMSNFYTLENTVKIYCDVMNLYRKYKKILPMNIFELRYEDLVGDMEGNVRRIINFIDMEWNDEILSYYESDKHRHIRTPNEGVMPVYKSSVGRWKNYRKQIAPYQDVLAPFIREYEYGK